MPNDMPPWEQPSAPPATRIASRAPVKVGTFPLFPVAGACLIAFVALIGLGAALTAEDDPPTQSAQEAPAGVFLPQLPPGESTGNPSRAQQEAFGRGPVEWSYTTQEIGPDGKPGRVRHHQSGTTQPPDLPHPWSQDPVQEIDGRLRELVTSVQFAAPQALEVPVRLTGLDGKGCGVAPTHLVTSKHRVEDRIFAGRNGKQYRLTARAADSSGGTVHIDFDLKGGKPVLTRE